MTMTRSRQQLADRSKLQRAGCPQQEITAGPAYPSRAPAQPSPANDKKNDKAETNEKKMIKNDKAETNEKNDKAETNEKMKKMKTKTTKMKK